MNHYIIQIALILSAILESMIKILYCTLQFLRSFLEKCKIEFYETPVTRPGLNQRNHSQQTEE